MEATTAPVMLMALTVAFCGADIGVGIDVDAGGADNVCGLFNLFCPKLSSALPLPSFAVVVRLLLLLLFV